MSLIIPAILSQTIADFNDKLGQVKSFTGVAGVHVDFADGRFVKNETLHPKEINTLPMNYVFSAHLMVEEPLSYVESLQKAGFEAVAFHFESLKDPKQIDDVTKQIQAWGMQAQLAFNPGTEVSKVKPWLKEVDSVVVMGVEPGFYGSEYRVETADKVADLREGGFYGTIIVDGGIKKENAKILLASGADCLVIGSAIFKQSDPKQAYQQLLQSL